MKTKLFFLMSIVWMSLSASHIEAQMTLRYAGTPGVNINRYIIEVSIYADAAAVGSGSTVNVEVASSCSSTKFLTLHQDTFMPHVPSITECAWMGSSAQSPVEYYLYSGYVDLAPCADYVITQSACCTGYYTNSQQGNISSYTRIEFDNTMGHHSVASPQDKQHKVFCTGRTFYWNRNYIDADGDSVHVEMSPAYNFNATANTLEAILLDPNYTYLQPLDVDSAVGFHLFPNNGALVFKPTQTGQFLVAFKVEEYKYDAILSYYKRVAVNYERTTIFVDNNCVVPTNIQLTQDTLVMECGVDKFKFQTSFDFYDFSLGSGDLILYSPSGPPVPIINMTALNVDGENRSDSIELEFFNNIQSNGIYKLEMRQGVDGDYLMSPCGVEFDPMKATYLKVANCNSVGVAETQANLFKLYPNPAQSFVTIETLKDEKFEVEVYNALGQVVLRDQFNGLKHQLQVEELPSGIYSVLLRSKESSQVISLNISR